jgi:uroporphyrinogen decarboxylase
MPETLPLSDPPRVTAPPDFNNLLAVLRREVPSRPTLFEFFLNSRLYGQFSAGHYPRGPAAYADHYTRIAAYRALGYDFCTLLLPGFEFPRGAFHQAASRSMNEGAIIHNRADFDAYPWPDMSDVYFDFFHEMRDALPTGMKFIAFGPDGVLENVVGLVGYENLCYLIADDPQLTEDIFAQVGARLVQFYRECARYDTVGALISNDDWGFKSQTLLSVKDMRRFVFPWHKRIVEAIHAAGKPAILHSCGRLTAVMDDIIDDMRFDAKHSYEDVIVPVEDAYDLYHDRIAILGGIDVDFVCRSEPEAIYARAKTMLERSATTGGYALGTGNSVPEYVPDANYFAMIRAALDCR